MIRINVPGGAVSFVIAMSLATAGARAQSVPSVPSPWKSVDVGAPASPGTAQSDGKTFSVLGTGAGITGRADQFHYVYQPIQGDVEIVARLAVFQTLNASAKAGVMIRESLSASARHAFMLGSPSSGWDFQRRLSAGGASYMSDGPSGRAPGWVKLVREGNLFTAFHSIDGSAWKVVDSDTLAMPTSVYVGFAVTSGSGSQAAAVFDNVAVRSPSDGNDAPSVSITSPAGGAVFNAGESIQITASASDPDGSVSRVDFYRGSALIRSDTSSPFTATLTNVAVGIYSLTAIAFDDRGQGSTSQPVSVSVKATTTVTLKFTPSTDHATAVTSYAVAVYRAVDPVTATPVTTRQLGKPAPVGGTITVDISTLVTPLPRGSYKAVVTAAGTGGSAASQPSPVFAY